MIQRVQTVYLLLVVILMSVMLFPTYATVTTGAEAALVREVETDGTILRTTVVGENPDITFDLWSIRQGDIEIMPTVYPGVLVVLTLLTALVAIFLYRKRLIQIRLCFVMFVLLLGVQSFIVFYIWKLTKSVGQLVAHPAVKYSVFDLFPLLGLLFVYLAFKGITRDEVLVRSLNRIR